jgi:hypothetical protein
MEIEARWSEMRRDGPNGSLSTDKAAREMGGRHHYQLKTMGLIESKENFTRLELHVGAVDDLEMLDSVTVMKLCFLVYIED